MFFTVIFFIFIIFFNQFYTFFKNYIIELSKEKMIFELIEMEYDYYYEAYEYIFTVNNYLKWEEYIKFIYIAIIKNQRFNDFPIKQIWFKSLNLNNFTNITINKTIIIDNTVIY